MLNTLPNHNPDVHTYVRIQTPYSDACPHSHMPLDGSWIAVSYWPAAVILELGAVLEHLPEYATEARDVETIAQLLARDCALALGVSVIVEAYYKLRDGIEMNVTCS